jgi:hypothetical protein
MSNPLVNIHAVASSISEYWSPRTVGVVNDYDVRFVKVKRASSRATVIRAPTSSSFCHAR